jgi:CRISP-associated protein Cas1
MNKLPGLPPPKPIPLKDRASIACIERGNIDVLDGAFVVVDKNGVRTHLPVGGLACLMVEPGARISHAAVALAAHAGTLIVWVAKLVFDFIQRATLEVHALTDFFGRQNLR